ncbi:hypothetical protein YA0637_14485 [Pseudomonas syringae]|uniref:hypothetical protein n=1 Tax=Pseudomonas syringae TaxID=317 RepID=UPI0018E5AF39|nr:hypothetical protein [Pseudomonas syringae]MBI6672751.1 hypothetical protein [Pseudomonas syringae]
MIALADQPSMEIQMDFDCYPDKISLGNQVFACARKPKEGILYVPYSTDLNVKLGDIATISIGAQTLELKVVDFASYPSQKIGTTHDHILELHTENISSSAHKAKEATSMISIGTLNGQQVQVGNGNTQNVNITIEQLAKEIAKTDDPKAKSLLKGLLENATVSSVIGAGVSGLIGLL